MVLRRTTFFLVLLMLFIGPFFLYTLIWVLRAEKTNGQMRFIGKTYAGQQTRSYSVIIFFVDNDTVWVNSGDDIFYKKGETVPVLYQPRDIGDARIASFSGAWGNTCQYACAPFIILLVIFFHRGIIPRGSIIRVTGKKPFIQVQHRES
jgi:hypothetical protein